ncbi:hypothetical protein GQ607_002875 [Colletotrichum asianum]|uniref:Uncharacterized protein n=1 Tax=Colletotrichum asianum TaxID=702518 RepID=A0A8H3WS84_9PEZI|nr:hypothetical protein GQ607_002875 [Colletotrichum asianum]
MKRISILV